MKKVVVAVLISLIVVAVAGAGMGPRFGYVSLSSGFQPDPFQIKVSAHGRRDASELCDKCGGQIGFDPDFEVYFEAGSFPLYIYVISEIDSTLVVNGPDGEWYGRDDFFGDNPLVVFDAPESGTYRIWIGSFDGSDGAATLFVSEVMPQLDR